MPLINERPDDPEFRRRGPETLLLLSGVLKALGRAREADEVCGQAVADWQKLTKDFPGPADLRYALANDHLNLGLARWEQGQCDEASFRRAVDILERLTAEKPTNVDYRFVLAKAQNGLAITLDIADQPRNAERSWRRAVELLEQLAAEDPAKPEYRAELADYLNSNLAASLYWQGRAAEAEPYFRRAQELATALVTAAPDSAEAQRRLAEVIADCPDARLRDNSRAVAAAKRAVELAPKDREAWLVLGLAHFRARDWLAAAKTLEKGHGLNPDEGSPAFFYLAIARCHLGESEKARAWYDRGVAWRERKSSEGPGIKRLQAEAAELLGLPMPPGAGAPLPPKD
jgi:tetratricopeptide (TPR) repeat protein